MELKRTLSLFDATAIGIGAIIGAGIFVVLGLAVGYAGPAVIISMIIAATVALFTALSFAELSSAIPKEGGTYEFAYEMIHPYVGFISGCLWLSAQTVSGTAISLGLASYLVVLFPVLGGELNEIAVIAALVLTVLNLIGLKYSATVNNILVLIKIAILSIFVVVGVFQIHPQNYSPFMPYGPFGILQGAGVIFFAYLGFGRVAALGEEVKDPKRTLPLSILFALAASAILYVITGLVATGLNKNLGNSGSPIALAASATGNLLLIKTVSLGAVVALVSVLLTNLLGLSRVSFAVARNRQFPKSLSRIHSKFGTPYVSILITGGLMATLASFLSLLQSAAITSFSMLCTHIILHTSAIRLRKKVPNLTTFKAPFFPLIPCLGLASCVILMFSLPELAWFVAAGIIIVSSVYYVLWRKHQNSNSSHPSG
jgi:APA family basic amino acid/polyamine antiporter